MRSSVPISDRSSGNSSNPDCSMRLDLAVAERQGISRNRARFLIESGLVSVNGKPSEKASLDAGASDVLDIREDPRLRYVARSALKLVPVFRDSLISAQGKSCLDIGSSTGGFVQVLLENGAASVTAVDVGTDQLHPSLRLDPRIRLFEQTDIRTFETDERFAVITIDVSFVSLDRILPSAVKLLEDSGSIVALFKPQFEVGRENLRRTGVPRSQESIDEALSAFRAFLLNA